METSYTYQRLIEGYIEWLDIIGYAKGTSKCFPSQIRAFLFYLKTEGIDSLENVPAAPIHRYYENLKATPSESTGKFLSASTLNGHIRNLKLFGQYLEETGQGSLQLQIKRERLQTPEVEVLSKEEVQQLYNACSEEITGLKERAILSLYYGCGLRNGEGLRLNLNDVLFDKQMIHVRQSKTGRARYVPFVEGQQKDFELYLKHCRPTLERMNTGEKESAPFLLNHTGQRMSAGNAVKVVKDLIKRTGSQNLQSRRIGIHTLRHSIATHLLQSGMSIETIAQFLGHQWISSTQIYLHLVHEL